MSETIVPDNELGKKIPTAINPKTQNKLDIIKYSLEQLAEDGKIYLELLHNGLYLPEKVSGWHHFVQFGVAPSEGIYDAEALQSFMMNLIPKIEPTLVDRFNFNTNTKDLELGKLYFDEEIGVVKRSFNIHDFSLLPLIADKGYKYILNSSDGNFSIDKEDYINRRTLVRVFPNEQFVEQGVYSISSKDIEKRLKDMSLDRI